LEIVAARAKLASVTHGATHPGTALVADWRDRAACSGHPHSLFFPVGDDIEDLVERARAICATCGVTDNCLEFALETNERTGIWGGTTEEERKSLRRKWLAARRR
jgi:WhiB family transcriptional regulator, redox-sensing transcriptional regulator